MLCGLCRVCGRQSNECQSDQLFGAVPNGGEFVIQVLHWLSLNGVAGSGPFSVDQTDSLAHDARPVAFGAQARAPPGHVGVHALVVEQAFGQSCAGFFRLFLFEPQSLRFGHLGGRQLVTCGMTGVQPVTAHLFVISHAEVGYFGQETAPVAPCTQKQQPIVAQPVLIVGALPALQVLADLGVAGGFEPQPHVPISRHGFQHMSFDFGQQRIELAAVATSVGVLQVEHGLICTRLCAHWGGQQGKQGDNDTQPGHHEVGWGGFGAFSSPGIAVETAEIHQVIMDNKEQPNQALREEKLALRKALLERRHRMPDRPWREELLQRVMRVWLIERPDTVIGAYWPIKGEFDPLPSLHRWKEDGELLDQPQRRRIGLPVVNKVHKTLTFHAWYPGCPMEEDAYGIPKPKDTELIVPTLLFVPCVGYGPGGYRLGYGGGFYDRTLASLQPKPFTVGLGFTVGFVDDFSPEPHDVPLDTILNENGAVWPV